MWGALNYWNFLCWHKKEMRKSKEKTTNAK